MLNGTQVSTALALDGLRQLRAVFAAAVVAGAMSVDAASGSRTRRSTTASSACAGMRGQRDVAALLSRAPRRQRDPRART